MQVNIQEIMQDIESLIHTCQRLQKENQALKQQQSEQLTQISSLTEKNRLACSRLEGILEKLKSIEDQ